MHENLLHWQLLQPIKSNITPTKITNTKTNNPANILKLDITLFEINEKSNDKINVVIAIVITQDLLLLFDLSFISIIFSP